MNSVVLATTNPGKVREFARLLADSGLALTVLSLRDVGLVAPPETGTTFAENARIKAHHAARGSGLPALADDSGLEVDGLGGAPGVYSARYAGEGADDEANRQLLIAALAAVPPEQRTGRFRSAITVALPSGASETVEGAIEGELLTIPRGSEGFGYDPLFFLPVYNQTMAELSLAEKNRISHRARATALAIPLLRRYLAEHQAARAMGPEGRR